MRGDDARSTTPAGRYMDTALTDNKSKKETNNEEIANHFVNLDCRGSPSNLF